MDDSGYWNTSLIKYVYFEYCKLSITRLRSWHKILRQHRFRQHKGPDLICLDLTTIYCYLLSQCKEVQDSLGFRIIGTGFQYQELGFWIPWAVFRIPKPRILDFQAKFSQIPDTTSKSFKNNPPKKCSTFGFVNMDYCNRAKLHHSPFQKPYRYDTDKNCAFLTTGMTDWHLI